MSFSGIVFIVGCSVLREPFGIDYFIFVSLGKMIGVGLIFDQIS